MQCVEIKIMNKENECVCAVRVEENCTGLIVRQDRIYSSTDKDCFTHQSKKSFDDSAFSYIENLEILTCLKQIRLDILTNSCLRKIADWPNIYIVASNAKFEHITLPQYLWKAKNAIQSVYPTTLFDNDFKLFLQQQICAKNTETLRNVFLALGGNALEIPSYVIMWICDFLPNMWISCEYQKMGLLLKLQTQRKEEIKEEESVYF